MAESTYLVNQCRQSADLFALSGVRGLQSEYFLQWVGYLFRYWSMTTEDTAAQIIEQAPVEDLRQMYQGLHVMSYVEVIAQLRGKPVGHASLLA